MKSTSELKQELITTQVNQLISAGYRFETYQPAAVVYYQYKQASMARTIAENDGRNLASALDELESDEDLEIDRSQTEYHIDAPDCGRIFESTSVDEFKTKIIELAEELDSNN